MSGLGVPVTEHSNLAVLPSTADTFLNVCPNSGEMAATEGIRKKSINIGSMAKPVMAI